MTSRERMLTALRNGVPDVVPTFLCYHGMYLSRHTTLEYLLEYRRRLGDRAQYPIDPEEDLQIRRWAIQRTLDLFIGRIDYQFGFPSVRPLEGDVITPAYIEAAIRYIDSEDVPLLGPDGRVRSGGAPPRGYWDQGRPLETRADVDRYFAPAEPGPEPPPPPPEPDPYADLKAKHRAANADLFRCGSFTTPFCEAIGAFSYAGTMLALHDRPEVFGYFIERATAQRLEGIRTAPVDGFWFDEYYTDVISPQHYEEYVGRPNRILAQALRQSGKASMYYFCGDIRPKLPQVLELEVDAIAFEESKKGFHLDVAEVKKVVGNRKALVGNMDGLHLLPRGTPEQIVAEVKRQLAAAARDGGFVMGAGSPIAPDTPLENMRAFLDTTREFGRYPMTWL